MTQARNLELGKSAAYQYEQIVHDSKDFSASVERFYKSNSVVSTLRPMSLFLQINLSKVAKKEEFLKMLT